jgi:hypothetical protein
VKTNLSAIAMQLSKDEFTSQQGNRGRSNIMRKSLTGMVRRKTIYEQLTSTVSR